MKAVVVRTLVMLTSVVLAVLFVVGALFVGTRVVTMTAGDGNTMLLVALAICGAALSILNHGKREQPNAESNLTMDEEQAHENAGPQTTFANLLNY